MPIQSTSLRGPRLVVAALACLASFEARAAAAAVQGAPDRATLVRAAVAASEPQALAARLRLVGLDVLDGSVGDAGLEVVVGDQELAWLEAQGLAPRVLERGAPFAALAAAVPVSYPPLAEVVARMKALALAHPDIAAFVDLTERYGTPATYEGRRLFALKVSDNVSADEDEAAAVVVGGHHARELVTPVIALDVATRLTGGYDTDPRIRAIVDGAELWIAPVWNPDGYEHVFQVDNLWRKNRRPAGAGVGVDLNRNYARGWESTCSGSASPTSETFKGPAAASEAETATMLAWSRDRRFARVLDVHSAGREVVYGYLCSKHPLAAYWRDEAAALSTAAGYDGRARAPSGEGEMYQWQAGAMAAHGYLIETATSFQPVYADAVREAEMVWPAVLDLLEKPASVSGHVRHACGGAPLEGRVSIAELPAQNGEEISSGGPFGRYHLFLPDGRFTLTFSAGGLVPVTRVVDARAVAPFTLDVELGPEETCNGLDDNCDGVVDEACAPLARDDDSAPAGGCDCDGSAAGVPWAALVSGLVLLALRRGSRRA